MFEDFELFENTRSMRCTDYITVTKTGVVIFPRMVLKKNSLEEKKAVKLFYNRRTKQAAFLFEDTHNDGSFSLQQGSNSKSTIIMAKTFLKFYGVKMDETIRYPYTVQAKMLSDQNHSIVKLLVIDVEEA